MPLYHSIYNYNSTKNLNLALFPHYHHYRALRCHLLVSLHYPTIPPPMPLFPPIGAGAKLLHAMHMHTCLSHPSQTTPCLTPWLTPCLTPCLIPCLTRILHLMCVLPYCLAAPSASASLIEDTLSYTCLPPCLLPWICLVQCLWPANIETGFVDVMVQSELLPSVEHACICVAKEHMQSCESI